MALSAQRQGLTLFEVGVSLLILALAISSVLMLFPVGLKAQQESRFRLLAAAQIQSLVSAITEKRLVMFGNEGLRPADRPYTNAHPFMPDLDASGWHTRTVLWPVPPSIAARLDSDFNEIADLLAEGGQLFYPSLDNAPWLIDGRQPPELYKLVLGVRGDPQQNALLYHPQVKWPYYEFHPASLMKGVPGAHLAEVAVLEALRDADSLSDTWLNDAMAHDSSGPVAALLAIGTDIDLLPATLPTLMDLEADYTGHPLRFVARTLLLRYAAFHLGIDCRTANGGFATTWPDSDPGVRRFQIAHLWQQAHQTYLQTHQPYDWRVPRDLGLQLFVDHPLLQFDLTTPPLRDPNAGNGIMHAWRLLASQPIRMEGSHTYPRDGANGLLVHGGIDAGDRAATTGWNLTLPFHPSERAREVIVWAVDWMAYRDAEIAPAAPMDAAQLPRLPHNNSAATWTAGQQNVVSHKFAADSNPPEITMHWTDPTRTQTLLATGLYNDRFMRGSAGNNTLRAFLGRHGADRNRNGYLDEGPLDPSLRLRATTIARFVVYDPRGFLQDR